MHAQFFLNLEKPDVIGGLAASAVLVDLTISEWVGRKKDRENTNKIVSDNHAKSRDAAHVTKKLFVDSPELQRVSTAAFAARSYVTSVTLPWMGTLKLLPMSRFLDFQDKMADLQAEYYRAVDDFLKGYDVQISAMAFKLGSLFKREEYPSVEEIRSKFSLTWNILPLPTNDFRVKAESDLIANLHSAYEKAMHDVVRKAMEQNWEKLRDCCAHIVDRLGERDDGKLNIFRDSMLENAKELVDLLRDLNIGGDEKMEQVRRELAAIIDHVEPDELRKNKEVRNDVRTNVAAILDKFQFI